MNYATAVVAGALGVVVVAHQSAPVFRTTTDAVTVAVSVQQRGRLIADLGAADFEIRDNGVLQIVTVASLDTDAPLDVDLLLDVSDSIAADVLRRAQRASADIQRVAQPGDRLRGFSFASTVHPADLRHPFLPPSSYEDRHTALWDALALLLMQRTDPERRKVIIVLTDALDTASVLPHDALRAIADQADAIVHVVALDYPANLAFSFASDGVDQSPFEQYCWLLKSVADRTGGEFFAVRPDGEFAATLRLAVEASRVRYLLRYSPQGVSVSGWHDLAVRVTRPGRFEVRARKGYQR